MNVTVSCSNLVSNLFFAISESRIFWKIEFLFHEDSQDTGVMEILRCMEILRFLIKTEYTLRCLGYIYFVYRYRRYKTLANVL